jgi:hypothetical protein
MRAPENATADLIYKHNFYVEISAVFVKNSDRENSIDVAAGPK